MITTDDITIAEITANEIVPAHELVLREFDAFIGVGYSALGRATFRKLITPEFIANLPQRNGFSLVAKYRDAIIGIFSVRDGNFIALFFVDHGYHNRGIGKKLFMSAKKRIAEKNRDLETIEVHSSPYAENIYAALGFNRTGAEKEEAGIRFVTMEYGTQKADMK